jgi:tetratricopeptide (TPR) repeat protein
MVFLARFRRTIDPLEWFGVFFFGLTLLPAIGIVSFGYLKHAFVSDHFMYLPVLGLSILLSSLMTRISIGRSHFLPGITIALVLLWSLLSLHQSQVWKSPLTFWDAVLRADPASWVGHENLATSLDQKGEIQKAYPHYLKATEIDPEEPIGWINLGRNLILQGRAEEAARALARAIDLNVFYVEAHLFRAEAFLKMGEEQKAVDQFHSAIAVRPGNTEARLKIADLLLHASNRDIRDPNQALRWLKPFEKDKDHPDSPKAWGLLAEAHAAQGNFPLAIEFEEMRLGTLYEKQSEEALAIRRRISFLERGFVPN